MTTEYLSTKFTAAATVTIEVVRMSDGARYDWSNATFKTSAWTTRLGPLLEDVLTPGLYRGSVDVSTWVDGVYDLVYAELGGLAPLNVDILRIAGGMSADAFDSTGIRLVTLDEVKRYLGIAPTTVKEDGLLEDLIDAATADIETYCQKAFIIRTLTDEPASPPSPRDRRFAQRLYLKRYPIVSVTRIVDGSGFEIPAVEYDVRAEMGVLWRSGGWLVALTGTGVTSRWKVTYVAGHWVDTAHVDKGLKLGCKLLIAHYRSRRAPDVASKSMGQVAVTYTQRGPYDGDGLPAEVLAHIGPWASRDV